MQGEHDDAGNQRNDFTLPRVPPKAGADVDYGSESSEPSHSKEPNPLDSVEPEVPQAEPRKGNKVNFPA